ncbi:hypothetical protein J6590_056264 [Homalodisca vitripennis]|nr:hypothetical protein J6590_056264 [Homalodisca vitripennis]
MSRQGSVVSERRRRGKVKVNTSSPHLAPDSGSEGDDGNLKVCHLYKMKKEIWLKPEGEDEQMSRSKTNMWAVDLHSRANVMATNMTTVVSQYGYKHDDCCESVGLQTGLQTDDCCESVGLQTGLQTGRLLRVIRATNMTTVVSQYGYKHDDCCDQ